MRKQTKLLLDPDIVQDSDLAILWFMAALKGENEEVERRRRIGSRVLGVLNSKLGQN